MTSDESGGILAEIADLVTPRIDEAWQWAKVEAQVDVVEVTERASRRRRRTAARTNRSGRTAQGTGTVITLGVTDSFDVTIAEVAGYVTATVRRVGTDDDVDVGRLAVGYAARSLLVAG